MNHSSKYKIPEFYLHEYIKKQHNVQLHEAPNRSVRCNCPIHNHSTQGRKGALRIYIEDNPFQVGWVCSRGRGNVWDFLREEGFPGPEDNAFEETILHICDVFDIEPELKKNYTPGPKEKARAFMQDVKEMLRPISFDQSNKHWDGTLYRGHNPFTWLSNGVGMLFPEDVETLKEKHGTQGFQAAGISKWSSYGYRWISEGVLILQQSKYGTPIGFGVRRYKEFCGQKPEPKYVKPSSTSALLEPSEYIFGQTGKKSDELQYFVVEGEFDALSLQLAGLLNTVTYGSGVPSAKQREALLNLNSHLVFISDADENGAGFHHLARLAQLFPMAEFIVLPGVNEDPDSYVQKYGAENLINLPRCTALEVEMMAEDGYSFDTGMWEGTNTSALVNKYMQIILDSPSAFDERDVKNVARFSGYEESYLRSWLFYERNTATLPDHPVRYQT